MNEHVKRIAAEANDLFRATLGEGADPGPFYHDKFIEIFSELLVTECASMCYRSSAEDGDFHAMNLLYEFDVDGARSRK